MQQLTLSLADQIQTAEDYQTEDCPPVNHVRCISSEGFLQTYCDCAKQADVRETNETGRNKKEHFVDESVRGHCRRYYRLHSARKQQLLPNLYWLSVQ